MGLIFGLLLIVFFVAMAGLQGGIVFGTARWAMDALHWDSSAAKLGLIALAYLLWAGVPVYAYSAMGGDGGLFDGFGLVLGVAFTGLVGSIGWAIFWVLNPSTQGDLND